MSVKSKLLKIIIPVLIVLAGGGVMAGLVSSRKAPKKEVKQDPGALVRVMEAKSNDRRFTVKENGTAQPARTVTLIPQVSGRVSEVSPSLVAGGFFRAGDLLFSIEDADYRLAVERAEAVKLRAEYELAKIESQAKVARAEWERLNGNSEKDPNPLVIYEPQLKDARGSLKSAEAALEQARLDLDRTRLFAPFDCIVRSENIERGAYVTPVTSAAVLSGTEEAEIIVPLPLEELRWIKVPNGVNAQEGADASVIMRLGGEEFRWDGALVRSLGEVDQQGRMMRVVVSVRDPYGLSAKKTSRVPLAFGTFVEVSINGRTADNIVTIPRGALRDGSTVWVADKEDKLLIKKVSVLRIEREEAFVTDGLSDGERVVITTIGGAADGMKLRPFSGDAGRAGL